MRPERPPAESLPYNQTVADLQALREFCARHEADFSIASGARRVRERSDRYWLENLRPGQSCPTVTAIRVVRFGRFGNNVMQLVQAIHIARKMRIEKIYIGDVNIGNIDAPLRRGDLELMPDAAPSPAEPVLAGQFYHRFCFSKLCSDLGDSQRLAIFSEYIRPLMAGMYPRTAAPGGHTLHIHIRSGDIFDERSQVHPNYVQPPLAYYAVVIRHALIHSGINKVSLVFQDRKNPCIDPLVHYLSLEQVAFEVHSGALPDAIGELATAQHLSVGSTSFAPMIAVIFDNLRTIYGFRAVPFRSLFKVRGVQAFVVNDLNRKYIQSGEWKNSKEQRRQMLDYGISALAISQA